MGTVAKALSLLDHFSAQRSAIGLSEMSRLSGINKATVYRWLGELVEAGFVEYGSDGRAYRLGSKVLRLAQLRDAAVPLVSVGKQLLQRLSAATGETAHMSLVNGDRLDEVAHVYSNAHATRVIMEDAETLSFHGTSSGMAILGFSVPQVVDRVLAGPLIAHTEDTLTDVGAIKAVLCDVRAQGFATYRGGYEKDVHSHAAPFFDAHGIPIGALAVAAPVSRMTPDQAQRIARLVQEAGLEMTKQTGGSLPAAYPDIQM